MPVLVIRSPSLTEQVIATLRQAIIAQEFEPGESLVEATTAARLGVSRGPLREAIHRLEIEGLVKAGRRGYVVVGISEEDIDEIYTLRGVLERLAVTLACERRTPEDNDRLRVLLNEMEEATKSKEPIRFAAADIAFHSFFYTMARHRRLLGMWEQIAPSVEILLETTNYVDRDLAFAAQAHRSFLEAFLADDLPSLFDLLDEHLRHSRELVVVAQEEWRSRSSQTSP
jgi:GntR family transcriptional regulator, gluconate operon transcriptional repressor